MLAASTPVRGRKRKAENELDHLTISPIQKHDSKRHSFGVPKVPAGTTIELVRTARPLADIGGISNLTPLPLSAVPPRLSSAIKPKLKKEGLLPPPSDEPRPRPSTAQKPISLRASTAGLNSMIFNAARASKRNHSVYPEMIVIDDSEDESQLAATVHSKTRKSDAGRRKSTRVPKKSSRVRKESQPAPVQSDLLTVDEFIRPALYVDKSKVSRKTLSAIHLQAEENMRLTTVKEERRHSVFFERSGYVAFESTSVKEENREYYNNPEENNSSHCPKITKFGLTEVESWKEIKDQTGCYFSRGRPAFCSGVDGEPFPSRVGYLKMSVKTKLEIATSPNNIVFTVVKGKGHLKDKTNGATEKTEMNIGDTFIIPKGSSFTFINLATKNEFILSYVKHT